MIDRKKMCYDAGREEKRQKGIIMLKKILKDSLPTIASLTLSGMYSVIDGLFIGRATGDIGLAAINIAWPITAVITATGIGIGAGGSVLVSNYRGQGKQKESKEAGNHTVTLLVVVGMLVTMLFLVCYPSLLKILGAQGRVYEDAQRYSGIIVAGSVLQVLGTGLLPILRNMDMAIGAMISMITGLFTNIGMDYYLLFEKNLGIQGVAYGTVTAQGVVVCISFLLLCKRQRIKPYLEKKLFYHTVKTGITAFGMSLAPSVTLIFTNWQCLKYGGEQAVACYAVISYITFPVQYMLSGIGDGTQPLLSYYHGADKPTEVRQIQKTAYGLAAVIGVSATFATILLVPHIGRWFGLSGEALGYFGWGMNVSAVAFLLIGFVKFNTAYLNATMQTKKAIFLTYIESIVIAPVLLYLLPAFAGIKGVWFSFPLTAVCMLLIYRWMMLLEKRRKDKK